MREGYVLDHTAVRDLARGGAGLAARVYVSLRAAQPLYVPGVCLAEALAEGVPGEVRQRIEEAFAAPCFVVRPLDEPGCWSVAQLAAERGVGIAVAHAAHVALVTRLPVLTRERAAYEGIDGNLTTEALP